MPSLIRMSRTPLAAVGNTHASSVMPVVRSSALASATVTIALVPLNDSAGPYFPVAVHVAPLTVPARLPTALCTTVPVPSLNPYAATRPGGVGSAWKVAV